MKIAGLLICVSLLNPFPASSQDAGPRGPDVEDLIWMAGRWVGESEGRRFEEHWSAPANGQMTGMFRWIEGDSVRFMELLVIEARPTRPVLLIRHFGPGLEPWEELPIAFELVELTGHRAVFEAEEEDSDGISVSKGTRLTAPSSEG